MLHFLFTDTYNYQYTDDLVKLQSQGLPTCSLPMHLQSINTPLQVEAWERCLEKHPDLAFVDYILSGIKCGFRIGFDTEQQLVKSKHNMHSAYAQPEVVTQQLAKDCKKGFTMGPLSLADLPQVHTSRIGVIPKKHQPGQWRLIVDLSSPSGKSINDGINKQLCSLSYTKIDHIVDSILQMGRDTLLAKIDIKSAFRIVPVHPADRYLLGMEWKKTTLYRCHIAIWVTLRPQSI